MAEAKKPCCPGKVELLIQSKASPFEEVDREWLANLEEPQIDRLVATDAALIAAAKKAEEPPQVNEEQAIQVLKATLSDPNKFYTLLPAELQEQMRSGLVLHREKRQRLINTIVEANPKQFTAEKLANRTMEALEELVSLIPEKADYSVNAAGTGTPVPSSSAGTVLLPTGQAVN